MALPIRLIEMGTIPEQAREVAITNNEFLIGRGADCDLRLPIDAISRHHCIIRVSNDEASVIDLGSSNGTYLNGQRVRSQAVLHGGDQLKLGDCILLVNMGEAAEMDTKLSPGGDPLAITRRFHKPTQEKDAKDEPEMK